MFSAVIVCAGSSLRAQTKVNKILLPLGELPIFMHSVTTFKKYTDDIIVVANEHDYSEIKTCWEHVVLGGPTRQDSVYNGVLAAKYENILIHDGARPFLTSDDLEELINRMDGKNCLFLGKKIYNSLKKSADYSNVSRDDFVEALTPQYVTKSDYLQAYQLANQQGVQTTDDVSLVNSMLERPIDIVYGSANNFKITTYNDYLLALELYHSRSKIGHSWDCHALVNNRDLILGGIKIPFEKGLAGHSDADALLHAIAESLLGALSLGDLGTHFPDNDPKLLGIDSAIILTSVKNMIDKHGYEIGNIDAMIYAEKPKMKPYIPAMRERIAKILDISLAQISIKATTYEHMDAIGRGEAIACDSTVILFRKIS